ncbi:MAG: hypothetical protein RLZZ387_5514 [Chloroflexota bacterium]|jgi:D-alanine-D-alanine ligase-like ATP-grasp enzyme
MTTTATSSLQVKSHYPFITRLLIELYQAGELPDVAHIDVEPTYGYAGRLVHRDGTVRFFRGKSFNINRSSSSEIAKDKGYTKYFLQQLGYRTPRGKVFLLPEFVACIDQMLGRHGFSNYATVDQIFSYVTQEIAYPCYIKPNRGAQGRGVNKCYTDKDVAEVVTHYHQEQLTTLIVEEAVPWPDYRVVVLKGQVISCYLRKPLVITGDGRATIRELFAIRQAVFVERQRNIILHLDDVRIQRRLARHNYTFDTVLADGQTFQVYEASNLSLGGEAEDMHHRIHDHWKELCRRISQDMDLLLCGIDLACADISDPSSDYSILEVNASPGFDNYAASGDEQARIVRNLYRLVYGETIFL